MNDLNKHEDRILRILDEVIENKSELKTPMESLVNHLHGLGIIGNEEKDKIVSAIKITLDDLGEKSVHISGAYSDIKSISSIIKKIFNL